MSAMASLITGVLIVYSTVYSRADQRKQHSSALLAFVRGIPWSPVNSPHKELVTRKMFPFDDVIMEIIFPFVVIKWNLFTRHQFPLDPKVSIVSKWDFILQNMDPYNNGMQIHHISKILSTCQFFELPMRNFPFFIAWILHVKIWGVHDIIRMELSYFNITSRACMGYILTGWFSSTCINKTHVYQEDVEVGVI